MGIINEGQDYFKFHKRTAFSIFYNNQVLLGVISECGPSPFAQSEKGIPLLFSFAKKMMYQDTQLNGELTDFVLKITRVSPLPTGRVEIGWCTFL